MEKVREILFRSSKKQCLKAGQEALKSEQFYNDLLTMAVSDEGPYCWRAGWSLSYLSESHPEVIIPQLRFIASSLPNIKTHTQIGSFLRIFDQVDFDLDEFGDVLDFCIHIIRNPIDREYVKVIALRLILKFGKSFPELAPELIEQVTEARKNFTMNHCKKFSLKVINDLKSLPA